MIISVIVVYNALINQKNIDKCIKYNVIPFIFDNSTNEDIRSKNTLFCSNNNLNYLTLGKNVGLSIAYNTVIKKHLKTNDDWLLILDQDTEINDTFFERINSLVEEKKFLSYFSVFKLRENKYCPKIIYNPYKFKVSDALNEPKEVEGHLLGINSCSLINKTIFDKVGLFNESLFLDYIDLDFCLRLATHDIKSKAINENLTQHFFNKEKTTLDKVKHRLSIQKKDAKEYYFHGVIKGFFLQRSHYLLDILKFMILYCRANTYLWFIPLLFTKSRKEEK